MVRIGILLINMAISNILFGLLILFISLCDANSSFSNEKFPNHRCIAEADISTSECSHYTSNKNKYQQLLSNIIEIKKWCGTLCNDISVSNNEVEISSNVSIYLPVFEKVPVVCDSLWNTSVFEKPNPFHDPIQIIPKYLIDYYSHYGRIRVTPHYYAELDTENHVTNSWAWTTEGLKVQMQWLNENRLQGNYGNNVITRIRYLLRKYMPAKDQNFLVIGSVRPWIEVILLAEGARHITTVEYNPYPCDHPNITTVSLSEFTNLVHSKLVHPFDAVVSYSSLEHSGLGRYGDHLNPWGDIISMARAWCLIKPKGRAMIGLPAGRDEICFNSHRKYGNIFFSRLFVNWKMIFSELDTNVFTQTNDCWDIKQQSYQPIHILEK